MPRSVERREKKPRRDARGGYKPRKLTKDIILFHALELTKANGLEAFSMKELADDIGVSTMATYRHFESREALTTALIERIYDLQLDFPDLQDANWDQRLRLLCRRCYDVFRQYPGTAPYVMVQYLKTEGRARFVDKFYELILSSNVDIAQAYSISHVLIVFTAGTAMRQERLVDVNMAEAEQFADQTTYKTLTKVLPHYPDPFDDVLFESGIDVILKGISASRT